VLAERPIDSWSMSLLPRNVAARPSFKRWLLSCLLMEVLILGGVTFNAPKKYSYLSCANRVHAIFPRSGGVFWWMRGFRLFTYLRPMVRLHVIIRYNQSLLKRVCEGLVRMILSLVAGSTGGRPDYLPCFFAIRLITHAPPLSHFSGWHAGDLHETNYQNQRPEKGNVK